MRRGGALRHPDRSAPRLGLRFAVGIGHLCQIKFWLMQLNHFKLLFMVDDETELFGIKPPSTQSLPISKTELRGMDVYPADGDNSQLIHVLGSVSIAYTNVTVRRKDLRRVIDGYLAEARRHAT